MIIRLFRARVRPEDREEFEEKFARISFDFVRQADGNLGVELGRPTGETPDEYLMISKWRDERALRSFGGPEWHQAVIPAGMEHLILDCAVDHFEFLPPTASRGRSG